MPPRRFLRAGESRVVAVSPVPEGLWVPLVVVAAVVAAVVLAAHTWPWVHRHEWWFAVAALPPLTVLAGRTARWRSHRFSITTRRVVEQRGVWRQRRSGVELTAVTGVRVERSGVDRLAQRGSVILDLPDGSVALTRLRHPDVVARVIDHVRLELDAPPDEPAVNRAPSPPLAEARELTDGDDRQRWRHLFGDREER